MSRASLRPVPTPLHGSNVAVAQPGCLAVAGGVEGQREEERRWRGECAPESPRFRSFTQGATLRGLKCAKCIRLNIGIEKKRPELHTPAFYQLCIGLMDSVTPFLGIV